MKCLHGGRRNYQDTLRCMGPMDLKDCPIRDRLFLAALGEDSRQALYTAGCVDRPGERLGDRGGGAAWWGGRGDSGVGKRKGGGRQTRGKE